MTRLVGRFSNVYREVTIGFSYMTLQRHRSPLSLGRLGIMLLYLKVTCFQPFTKQATGAVILLSWLSADVIGVGATENAGLENAASESRGGKRRTENAGLKCRDGK